MTRGVPTSAPPTPFDRLHFANGMKALPARIATKITHKADTNCWLWTAAKQSNGYGRCWTGRRTNYAHRFVYQTLYWRIPKRRELDHLCRNRLCVNPEHLQPVTKSENLRRGLSGENIASILRAKTACPKGHPYDDGNTSRRQGRRYCRACDRDRARRNRRSGMQQTIAA